MSLRATAADSRLVAAIALVVMLGAPPSAHAAYPYGLDLGWDACGVLGVENRDFSCDVNSADDVDVLVASFAPRATIDTLLGATGRIVATVPDPALPAWWNFANCRPTSMLASTQLSSIAGCAQAWRGTPSHLVSYQLNQAYYLSSVTTIVDVFYADGPRAKRLLAGTEYAAFVLLLDHARTIGSGACAGCEQSVCLTFVECRLRRSEVSEDDMVLNNEHRRWWASWQGGYYGGPAGCARAVPARAKTWGAIKSMYR